MMIKERIKDINKLTFEEMEDIFGRDYRNNILKQSGQMGDKLIFSEDDNLYYIDIMEHPHNQIYYLLSYKEVDNEMFEAIYGKYQELMNEVKILEKIITHKKFRIKKIFKDD